MEKLVSEAKVMLRKRSRPVSSGKQSTISDHNNNKNNSPSPNSDKSHKPTAFFKDFFLSPTSIMSPSSVLDTKPFSPTLPTYQIQNPKTFSWEQPGIGLVLFDDHPQLGPISTSKSSKQRSKLVVFGSHLKIRIPPQLPTPPAPASPQSPIEFGIKTPKSSLLGHVFAKSGLQQEELYSKDQKRLSVKDMELSEDYTCVISHGPNPKTTHIFGNCIVKSCCGVASTTASVSASSTDVTHGSEGFSFLSFCHHCNNKIGQGKDIYMYRGEKAFCSQVCRGQEMLSDGIEC